MNTIIGYGISLSLLLLGISIPPNHSESVGAREVAVEGVGVVPTKPMDVFSLTSTTIKPAVVFTHGDISWLPELATQAGWKPKHIARLGEIILRESGGCPDRKGGDIVNKNCDIIGHDGSNHRSDSGLLQINGVNYDLSRNKWAAVCTAGIACSQEPLLDAVTNLRAGYELFRLSGWGPWDPCQWGPEYAHRCKKTNKP